MVDCIRRHPLYIVCIRRANESRAFSFVFCLNTDKRQVGRYIPPAWLQHTEVAEWAGEVEKLWPDLISKDLQVSLVLSSWLPPLFVTF